MYLDIKGYVTVGIGCLLPTPSAAMSLPFRKGERLATPAETYDAFARVRAQEPALAARYYAEVSDLRLPERDVYALAETKLAVFVRRLESLVPRFSEFPSPVRRALIDMAWNCGIGGLARFTKLLTACNNRDWVTASKECRRKGSRPERNEWTRALFEAASQARPLA
jgi:GH24 family phage-related lysozyme (muramidase)